MATEKNTSDPDIRRCWNYDFCWTPEHLTHEQMQPLRHTMDDLASDCIEPLTKLASKDNILGDSKPNPTKLDMYALLSDNHEKHDALTRLWGQINTVPDWVDWAQIERGQKVYYRYGHSMGIALAFQSLLGGMGSGNIVETLGRTGGFSAKVVRHRLLETLQHTLQVTKSVDSIRPGGDGHVSTVRVRLLHALVRNRILQLVEKRPAYYDVAKHGIPINDLDSIGTICSFAPAVIYIGLPRQGIFMTDQEATDYTALWRLIAYYIGTPTEWFETPNRARAIMESLMVAEINPTRMSGVLARNIIQGLKNTPPLYASKGVLDGITRSLIGNELSNELGIGNPDIFTWIFVGWVFIYAATLTYVCRSVQTLDEKHVQYNREKFWRLLMDAKTGLGKESNFDFKYVPTDDKTN
ncbi:hypothetical protein EYB26_006300 [Talaromyces marneffei]|uniref:uncharacterized protein n=1 Tax=Talaromyces marneffei TaxID=37727 RepID=UPI0012A8C793|nr:uncharacterized protein EYB26_006300 [Talaromyces marneffei]QGA18615.1 hypothetical protein EYB26_006300 [Talaromyces marneffei]